MPFSIYSTIGEYNVLHNSPRGDYLTQQIIYIDSTYCLILATRKALLP